MVGTGVTSVGVVLWRVPTVRALDGVDGLLLVFDLAFEVSDAAALAGRGLIAVGQRRDGREAGVDQLDKDPLRARRCSSARS